MADNRPEPEKVRREWLVRGDFDPDAARVIAWALIRDGLQAEGEGWNAAADQAEQWNQEDES